MNEFCSFVDGGYLGGAHAPGLRLPLLDGQQVGHHTPADSRYSRVPSARGPSASYKSDLPKPDVISAGDRHAWACGCCQARYVADERPVFDLNHGRAISRGVYCFQRRALRRAQMVCVSSCLISAAMPLKSERGPRDSHKSSPVRRVSSTRPTVPAVAWGYPPAYGAKRVSS